MRSHVSRLRRSWRSARSCWAVVWAAFALAAACRAEPEWGDEPTQVPPDDDAPGDSPANGAKGGTGANGGTGAKGGSGANGGTGAASSIANGGAASTLAPGGAASAGGAAADEGAAGAGETQPNPDAACHGQSVSWDELQSGQVRVGAEIALAATVTSQKFLLSHSKAGSCLWGAFVGAEAVAGKPRGLLLVSYGEPAQSDENCPTGTDGLPDALAPGLELAVVGRYSPYAPSSCEGAVPAPQLRVEAVCPVVISGKRMPIAPVTLSHAEADAIARGADAAVIRQYAGGLVRLEDVSGVRAEDGEGVVAPYGVLRFAETQLEVHNDVEYGAVTGGGQPLSFAYPWTFAAVTGLVHLDYCSWALVPRDRCRDFEPPSSNCAP